MLLNPKIGINVPYKTQTESIFTPLVIQQDNIKFHALKSVPITAPKGRILLVHGWCEHAEMYRRIMEYLSGLGYECLVFDQRGSGRTSLGKYRGRCGRNSSAVYKDVDFMIEYLNDVKGTDSCPLYLIGHSAGGGIVLNYILQGKYKDTIAGVITTGPFIRIADKLAPSPYLEWILNFVASWFPYLPWGAVNTDPSVRSVITKADEWVDYLQQELLTQGTGTLGQIKFMFDRGYNLSRMSREEMDLNPSLKLLTIHCVGDPMTSFKYSKEFFDKVPLKDKKFVTFEKDTHSLFIETDETFQETCHEIEKFFS